MKKMKKIVVNSQEKKRLKLWADAAKAESKFQAAWRKACDYEDKLWKMREKANKKG